MKSSHKAYKNLKFLNNKPIKLFLIGGQYQITNSFIVSQIKV